MEGFTEEVSQREEHGQLKGLCLALVAYSRVATPRSARGGRGLVTFTTAACCTGIFIYSLCASAKAA